MASVDIKAMIAKKETDRIKDTKLVLRDVNRELIIALTALPVYGKETRDEEILSIIINGGVRSDLLEKIRENFLTRVKNKEIKKVGKFYKDKDGFIVLAPRV